MQTKLLLPGLFFALCLTAALAIGATSATAKATATQAQTEADGITPLMQAARTGQLSLMRLLIAQKAEVNARTSRNGTALMYAVDAGPAAIQLLLEHGADIDAESAAGYTALAISLVNKRPETFRALLAAGAKPTTFTRTQQSLLHLAAGNGQLEAVKQLLALGLDATARDAFSETPLIKAAENGYADIVKLLARKSPLAHANAQKQTALSLAAENGHLDVIKALLEAGAPVTGAEGDHAIANAVEAKQFEIIRFLLEKGANPNARGTLGRPLVSLAAWTNRPDIALLLLLGYKADPNLASDSGQTPLQMAAEWTKAPGLVGILIKLGARPDATTLISACAKPEPEMLGVLIHAGMNLNATAENETCLHAAARKGATATIDFLLKTPAGRAQMDAGDNYGNTPLMRASKGSTRAHTAVLKALLAAGSPLEKTDDDGNTALHLAAEADNAEGITLLRDKGAKQSRNELGQTPLELAAQHGKIKAVLALDHATPPGTARPWLNKLVIALVETANNPDGLELALTHYGAAIDQASRDEALYWAANTKQPEAARILLAHGANPENPGNRFGPALVWAQSVEMAALLIQHGANINATDSDGQTALIHASDKGDATLVRWLLAHGAQVALQDSHGWNALDYANHTGLRAVIEPITLAGGKTNRPTAVRWASDVTEEDSNNGFDAQALVVGDLLIAGHQNGHVYAFDRNTGLQRWKRWLGGNIDHEIRQIDGDLFVTSNGHTLDRIRPHDGSIVWHFAYSGGQIGSGAWAWRDLAVFVDLDGMLRAVDRSTGKLRWEKKLTRDLSNAAGGEDAVRLAGDALYFITESGLNRFDLGSGQQTSFPAKEAGLPEIAEGYAFLPSKQKHFYVLDARTLKLKQDIQLEDQSLLRPLYQDGRVYLPLRKKLLAFSLRPKYLRAIGIKPLGSPDWQAEITSDLYARPVWANGRLFTFAPRQPQDKKPDNSPVAGFFCKEQLVTLDPASGQRMSALLHEHFQNNMPSPAITNDTVYILKQSSIGAQRVLAVKNPQGTPR